MMPPPPGRPEGLTMGDAALIKKLGIKPDHAPRW
jgi:hypothetical protein